MNVSVRILSHFLVLSVNNLLVLIIHFEFVAKRDIYFNHFRKLYLVDY
jgi:hypothetical protein